jgi:hypothetical protein
VIVSVYENMPQDRRDELERRDVHRWNEESRR